MKNTKKHASLNELLASDAQSRQLFETLAPQQQVALQEQQQHIHTYADLESAAEGMQKQSRGWQAK